MPWGDVPGFMNELGESIMELALQFLILTAARSGEVRSARWSEIDLDAAVWTIPAERTKTKEEYRIPLTDEALAVLKQARGLDGDLVFPGQRQGRPLSDMSLITVLKRLNVPVTVHGFRSTFRDWASERTNVPREIAEMCLAHTVGNAVERAYARSDLFEKRRKLMDQWARFCLSAGSKGDVVKLETTVG